MLASTAVRAQVAEASGQRLQRQYLAEGGLNLALYYIQNPDASPVSLVYGEGGNVHYPGEVGVTLPGVPGSIEIAVDNPENGLFNITSAATHNGETTTSQATIKLTKSHKFEHAVNLSGNLSLNNKVTINGGIRTDGTVTKNSATVNGTIVAANGQSLGGVNVSGVEYSYPVSALNYLPYYFHEGKRYKAARAPKNVIGVLQDLNVTDNPCNVWYIDRDTKVLGAVVVAGTILMDCDSELVVQGTLQITPASGMPALVAGGEIKFSSSNRSIKSHGLTYVGGPITGSGNTSNCLFEVVGAFVSGQQQWPFGSGYSGSVNITYNESKSTASAVFDEMESIDSLTVQSWGQQP
jgi:hypothetical protein